MIKRKLKENNVSEVSFEAFLPYDCLMRIDMIRIFKLKYYFYSLAQVENFRYYHIRRYTHIYNYIANTPTLNN